MNVIIIQKFLFMEVWVDNLRNKEKMRDFASQNPANIHKKY